MYYFLKEYEGNRYIVLKACSMDSNVLREGT
jgi:hypothetical protein